MLMRKLTALLLALLLLAACCCTAQAEDDPKKLTVMVYMCGADLEPRNAQASRCIGNMVTSRYNADAINVIILAGGTPHWSMNYDPGVLTLVSPTGLRGTVLGTMPLSSMGEADTLTRFLIYCHDNYPAEKYILTMWDHGGGPLMDLMADYNFDQDGLDMHELDAALRTSPFADKGLDLIQFHACLMSSAEVAKVVAPYARYMVASEDSWYGFTYNWLSGADTDATIVDTCRRMIDDAYDYNLSQQQRSGSPGNLSLALIDLSRIEALVSAMDAFFPSVSASLDQTNYTVMAANRRDSQTFGVSESGGFTGYDLVDLGDLVRRNSTAAPAAADNLLRALDEAVVYQRSLHEDCTGLTVYHPYANKEHLADFVSLHDTLDFSGAYSDYIHRFAALLTARPMARWADLTTAAVVEKDMRTLFRLPLTPDQAGQLSGAALQVLHRQPDGSCTLTNVTREVDMDGDVLSAEYNGTALYAATPVGTRLSPALPYALSDQGTYVIHAVLSRRATEETIAFTEQALVSFTLDAESHQLIPGSVQTWFEPYQAYTTAQGTTLTDYDLITIPMHCRAETRDAQGTLLPFDQWEIVRTEEWSAAIDGSWALTLVSDAIDPAELCATFCLTDSQNNRYNSDLLAVKTTAVRQGEARLTYDDLHLARINSFTVTPGDGQLLMSLALENLTDVESILALESLTVNGIPCPVQAEAYGSGANWGLLRGEEQYLSVIVPGLEDVGVVTGMTFSLNVLDAATGDSRGVIAVSAVLHLPLNAN